MPFCYLILNGLVYDLTALCQPVPTPIVELQATLEPDYVREARQAIADPNASAWAINTAKQIINKWEWLQLSQPFGE